MTKVNHKPLTPSQVKNRIIHIVELLITNDKKRFVGVSKETLIIEARKIYRRAKSIPRNKSKHEAQVIAFREMLFILVGKNNMTYNKIDNILLPFNTKCYSGNPDGLTELANIE